MIVITGAISIDPAKRDQAIAAAIAMEPATRKEPGCLDYAFSADLTNPGVLYIVECWASQAALDSHLAEPHMAAFMHAMKKAGVRGLTAKRYMSDSVETIPLPKEWE